MAQSVLFGSRKKANLQSSYLSATTKNPSVTLCHLNLILLNVLHIPFSLISRPPQSSSILHLLCITYWTLHSSILSGTLEHCYCGRKVADLDIHLFLLPNKTEWTLVYSPETPSYHLQLVLNWICRLGRYLMGFRG